MSAFDLDFTRDKPRPQALAWLLLLAGGLAAGLSVWAWTDASRALDQARARVAALAEVPPPRAAKLDAVALARQREAVATGRQLALPWAGFLRTLQDIRPDEIAVLALDADGRRGDFNLEGLARSEAAMLAYYHDLRHAPGLADVSLTRHALQEDAGQRRVAFNLRGIWTQP